MASEYEELFEGALKLMHAGKNREAFAKMRKLVENMPSSSIYEVEARYLSYYGYLTGIVDHDYKRAIALCNEAIKKEFFQPDFYLNLGRLYLAMHNKGMAVKTFNKGLKVDNEHEALLNELQQLGIRKTPVFSFMRRGHFMNRMAGKTRSLLHKLLKGEK